MTTDRRAALAKVHIAAKALALDDGTYRALLRRVTGKESARDMDDGELGRVIEELKRLGWRDPGFRRGRTTRAGGRPLAAGAQAAKIRALWLDLYHLGEVEDSSEEALARFVERTAGVAALQWLDPRSADKAIRALRGWLKRVGFEAPTAERVRRVDEWRAAAALQAGGYRLALKVALLEAQWQRLRAAGALRHGEFAHLGTWLRRHGVAAAHFLDERRADRAIEELGEWVRRARRESKNGDDAA